MKYDIVTLEEKVAAGLSARTNNNSPDMGSVIGGLWQQFYSDNGAYGKINNKANEKSLGIYSDYAGDEKDDYTVTAACEVTTAESQPAEVVIKKLPAGKYARFVVEGHMQKAVADFWEKLWTLDLDRSFTCDFEEYQNADMEHAVIHIYISLK